MLDIYQEIARITAAVEAASYHLKMFVKQKDKCRTEMRKLIEQGLSISGIEYARIQERRLQQYADATNVLKKVRERGGDVFLRKEGQQGVICCRSLHSLTTSV